MDKSTFLLIQFLPNSQCSKSVRNVKHRQDRLGVRLFIHLLTLVGIKPELVELS